MDKGGRKMKKLLLGTILLAFSIVVPSPTMAGVDISIGISLPPLFVLDAPPVVIAMPDTNNVYVVPDIDADIFFWNGWWWMPWEGRWYRSSHYNRGWAYYNNIPSFYYDVDPDWRRYYRDRNWYGHRWDYERIPHQRLTQNWKAWQNNRHWERRRTWGIQNYRPRPQQQRQDLRYQRKQQYQQRPEVQRHQQTRQQPQAHQPRQRVQQHKQKPQAHQPKQRVQQHKQQPQSGGGPGTPPLRGFGYGEPTNPKGDK
jgi:hypothetical protein